ncbi:MAG: hypothetical protein PF636_00340 [Actinomycetota bacterium]|jgi:predicted ATP-grasp superfamily ATP-dependent carboligase|nr:hypothetical protein [Actinomycetota bacterium]
MDERVLVAGLADWWGLARIARPLALAGCEVTTFAPAGQLLTASGHAARHIIAPSDPVVFARELESLLSANEYALVVLGDEPVLYAAMAQPPGSVLRRALPIDAQHHDVVGRKDAFLALMEQHGVPVPRSAYVEELSCVGEAAESLGGRVFVKRCSGWGGIGVRGAESSAQAIEHARELGMPVVIEETLEGRVGFACALWDHGRMLGAFTSYKATTFPGPLGGSAMMQIVEILGLYEDMARIGEILGFHGFGGIDFMEMPDGTARALELQARPTSQVHAGVRVEVDFAALVRSMLDGATQDDSERVYPVVPPAGIHGRRFPMFPTELLRSAHDRDIKGLVSALLSPRLWRDVPWHDPSMLVHYPGALTRKLRTRKERRSRGQQPSPIDR